jgi:gliding motility-associated-like protein
MKIFKGYENFAKILLLAISIFISSPESCAQGFNFNYVRTFGSAYTNIWVKDMSVDSLKNVVLLGTFSGTIDFDTNESINLKTSQGGNDIFVAKYNPLGDLLWVQTFGGMNDETAGGVDFDSFGNVVFSGNFNGEIDVDPSDAINMISSAGSASSPSDGNPAQQLFLVKLNNIGLFQWVYFNLSNYISYTKELAINSSDEIIFNQQKFVSYNFNGAYYIPNSQASVNKISPYGELIWSQTFDSVEIYHLDVGSENEIIISGVSGYNNFLKKFDSNGLLLVEQNGIGNAQYLHISNGVQGEYFVGGLSTYYNYPSDLDPSPTESFIVGNNPQYYLVKYSSSGAFIWAKTSDIFIPSSLYFSNISVSSSGNVFLSGNYQGQVDFNPSITQTSITASQGASGNIIFLKLSPNGDFISKKTIGGAFSSIGTETSEVNNDEELFIAGGFGTSENDSIAFNPNNEFIDDTGLISSYGQGGRIFFSKFSTCRQENAVTTIFPISQDLCINSEIQPLSFTYLGPGTPTYQWYSSESYSNIDGTLITGSNTNSFTPTSVSALNNFYYCTAFINATGCSVSSSPAQINVSVPPVILTQALENQIVCLGGTPIPLSIQTLNPLGNESFQWYSNSINSNSGGIPIYGATSNSFSPGIMNSVGTTYYYCKICSAISSNTYQITVVLDPVIATQPISSQTICIGGDANTISAIASGGTGIFSYQWFNSSINSPIIGATSNTYTPTSLTSINNYSYYVQISQSGLGCNVMNSIDATINVIPDPIVSISSISPNYFCSTGTILPLELSYSGEGGIFPFGVATYQWYYTSDGSNAQGTIISGATTGTYTPVSNASYLSYYGTVILTTSGCSTNSPSSPVITSAYPSISIQPIPQQTVCQDGTPLSLNVSTINGAGPPLFQWWSNDVNSYSNATSVPNATGYLSSFNPPTSNLGSLYYFCTISYPSSNCGLLTSNISNVTVVADPEISSEPYSYQTICVGGNPNSLTIITAGGTGAFSYQWYDSSTNSAIQGANSAIYNPGVFNTISNNSYYVQVNQSGAGCNTLTSTPALVTVVDDPIISTSAPAYQIICEQSNIDSLEILVSGGTQLSYQWFIAPNSNIVGNPIANANSLVFTPTMNSVSNNFYYCQVTSNGNGCTPSINSTPFQIEIVDQPQIINSAYSVEACQNNTMPTLEIAGNYDTNPIIHFFQSSTIDSYNGSEVSSSNFTPSSNTLGNYSYYFTYNVSFPGCMADTSDFYNVTISEIPQLNLGSTEPIIGCVGAEIDLSTFSIPNLSIDYILVWNLDNSSSDTTYASNAYSNLAIETAGNHNMQVQIQSTLDYCSATDELNLSIDIVPDPTITEEQNFIQDLCPFDEEINAPSVLVDFNSAIAPANFHWYEVFENNLIEIQNANQNSYLPQLPVSGIFRSKCIIEFNYPGCELSSSVSTLTFNENNLDCYPEIVIPDAISPNNDGLNDNWTINEIEMFNDYEVNIFNSFGQSIYFVKNTPPYWDGTWNGQILPNGDYFYSLKLYELNRTIFGTISIAN